MWARIELAPGVYVDARNIPVALVTLVEGPVAAVFAVLPAVAFRASRGGSGALAGMAALLAVAVVATLVYYWARRDGSPRWRHAAVLGAAVFVLTYLSFAVLGVTQRRKFTAQWAAYFGMYAIGIAVLARLFHDIGERARLAVERARFRAVLDDASDAIRIVDPDSMRIIDANLADCRLIGRERGDVIGHDVRDVWPGEPDLRGEHEALEAEVRAAGFARRLGVPYRSARGGVVRMDVTARTVVHGGRRYDIVVARDATDREAAEAARREAAELRAINLMAGTTAHEINNPLAVIVGSLSLLVSDLAEGSKPRRLAERSIVASHRIRDIVKLLTSIRRLETHEAVGQVPPLLDLHRSAEPVGAPGEDRTGDDRWKRSSTRSSS